MKKALKALKTIMNNVVSDENPYYIKEFDIIEQALLKAEKQEDKAKAFDLINKKRVDIKLLHWAYPSVEAYNVKVREQKGYWWREELTKEEFEFLGKLGGAK